VLVESSGTRVTVAADTAGAYLQIRGYQARLAVADRQIVTDREFVKFEQKRRGMRG
jgi:outer membrane protein TolC